MSKFASTLKRTSPTILSVLGSVGVIGTGIMAAKATPKAMMLLKDSEEEKHEPLTTFEKVQVAAPAYISAALVGMSTIVCIFGANLLNRRQQTVLTSAYALVNNAYKEYRNKVRELHGEETDRSIVESIAVEKASRDIVISTPTLLHNCNLDFGDEDLDQRKLFYDRFSNRYFESTVPKVLQAQYHLNRNFMIAGYISLNEFYDFLGIERTEYGNVVGWSSFSGDIYWIDFNNYKANTDDGLECYIIDVVYEPTTTFMDDV